MLTINKIRCVLVQDHVLLRQGLRRLFEDEPDIEVVAEAGNAGEALQRILEHRPDIVIADPAVFALAGEQVEMMILRSSPQTEVLFLSMQEGDAARSGELRSEGNFTARRTSAQELLQMVRKIYKMRSSSREPARKEPMEQSGEGAIPRERTLTAREREVLKLLAEGRTVRSAASVLRLSAKTVDAHKFNLMRKLGIHNKAELVMWAIQKRLVKMTSNS